MRRSYFAVICTMLLLVVLFPAENIVKSNGVSQIIITPYAAGKASDGSYFPLEHAFDSTNIAWDSSANEPIGDGGTSDAPYYANRVGFIDFGPDWSNIRITSTWTKYRPSSNGDQTPFIEVWWDDDTDSVNDSNLIETEINFNSAQALSTGSTSPWVRDSDVSDHPVTPKARYLMLRSPDPMTNRAMEYAIVGWVEAPGNETLQLITPAASGVATGSAHYPLENAFDDQPQFDDFYGVPEGEHTGNDAPAYKSRVGYIDFGSDWSKVRIVSTWTQYRKSSNGDQTPYEQLWWDDDTDTVNDSGFAETRINFNTAQNLSTGASTPWIQDFHDESNPVIPQARYLLLRSSDDMSNRAMEYAIVGWIDENDNGVQDVAPVAVTQIDVSSENDVSSLLTNETLQMSATVYPYIATNKSFAWSVENDTGSATINANGLLTPVSSGLVTVKATALDGSQVFGSKVINISKYEQLILPVQGQSSIYYTDVQASFPQINWQTIERLYIPAGEYNFINLGNLPERTANNPLIITNYGGQVKVGGTHTYTVVLGGGSNWILTGEYDSIKETGHPDYLGHQNGDYANAAGNYGIWVDRTKSSSIAVGKKATDFEISFIEIGFSGFAGLLIKSDNDPTATMSNVKIHDMYIHDTDSEGMYIGNTKGDLTTQHTFINLEIYNNRVLRTGTEGIQLANMGDGLKVHHNVVAMCAMGWKDPFQKWQDGCFQYAQGSGSSEIYNNIFIGGASKTLQLWLTATDGEPLDPNDEVWIHNNYFSHARNFFSYLNHTPKNTTTTLRFENNIIRQYHYHYDELPISHTDPNVLISANANPDNPLIFDNNLIDGTRTFIDTIGGDNGTVNNVSASGNVRSANLDSIEFNNVPFPANFDWSKVEMWDDTSQLYGGDIYFSEGDYVIYMPTGEMYVCIEPGTHTGKNPLTHPTTWQLVPIVDDFQLDANSPYQGIGLLP